MSLGENMPLRGNIMTHQGKVPDVDETTFVAPGAHVIGEVTLGAHTSIWYNCVVRGDQEPIHIGARTNLQDGSVVHTSKGIADTWIGENVLIGHGCIIHGCRLEDRAFIGMGSVVLDLAVVEAGAMLAAGSVLTPGKRIPSGELWGGSPARYMRDLRAEESVIHAAQVEEYVQLGISHTASLK